MIDTLRATRKKKFEDSPFLDTPEPIFRAKARGLNSLTAGLQFLNLYPEADQLSLVFYTDAEDIGASLLLERQGQQITSGQIRPFRVQGAYLRQNGWAGDYDEDVKHFGERLLEILSDPNAQIAGYTCFIKTRDDHYTCFDSKDPNFFMINLARVVDETAASKR